MSRLQHIWDIQLESQELANKVFKNTNACTPEGCPEEREAKFKENVLYLIKEATEVLDEINYKKHVITRKEIDIEKVKEELVDIFKFWLNLCLLFGITADDMVNKFLEKTVIVNNKFKEEANKAKKNDV